MAGFSNVSPEVQKPSLACYQRVSGLGADPDLLPVSGLPLYPNTLLLFPGSFPSLRVTGWGMGDSCPHQSLSASLQAASEADLLTLC